MLRSLALCLTVSGCSGAWDAPPAGQISVALTIDWEGAYVSADGLDAIGLLRQDLGGAPVTHFMSAGYFTKTTVEPAQIAALREAVRDGDELAVHIHGWTSVAVAAGVELRVSPSFLTGTDKLVDVGDGDPGFDLDLDAYTAAELRAIARVSRDRLAAVGRPVSTSFRAGGYLGTPKLLQAIRDEGFTVDSSATTAAALGDSEYFSARVAEIWPAITPASQPSTIQLRGGDLLEVPLSAIADHVTVPDIVGLFEAARVRRAAEPDRDVVIVLGFHQETATDHVDRLDEALRAVRARPELAGDMAFVTIDEIARRARAAAARERP